MSKGRRTAIVLRAGWEFVVIVIGVLVALALENWASNQADRDTEREYLGALARDLRQDSAAFADILLPDVVHAEVALRAIAPVVRGRSPMPRDTIAFLQQVISSTRGFSQLGVRTTFDELLATGSLRLVQSATLRSAISAYYGAKDLAATRAQYRASGYAELVRGYLPDDVWGSGLSTERADEESIRGFGIAAAVAGLRLPEFAVAVNRHSSYLDLVIPMLEDLQAGLALLIRQVDNEIARLG